MCMTGDMAMKFKVVLYPSEEGVAVCAPSLPGCWSQGESEEEALSNIAAAIREYLEVEIDMDQDAEAPGDVRERALLESRLEAEDSD
jgi:predicted RNase H-like HicB family nuclease